MATVYETMQGMLWLGPSLFRPIDLSRRLDEARLLDEAHPNGGGITSPIDERLLVTRVHFIVDVVETHRDHMRDVC